MKVPKKLTSLNRNNLRRGINLQIQKRNKIPKKVALCMGISPLSATTPILDTKDKTRYPLRLQIQIRTPLGFMKHHR